MKNKKVLIALVVFLTAGVVAAACFLPGWFNGQHGSLVSTGMTDPNTNTVEELIAEKNKPKHNIRHNQLTIKILLFLKKVNLSAIVTILGGKYTLFYNKKSPRRDAKFCVSTAP